MTRFSHGPITPRPLSDSWAEPGGRPEGGGGGEGGGGTGGRRPDRWKQKLSVGCKHEAGRAERLIYIWDILKL